MKSPFMRIVALIALPALVAAGLYFYGQQSEAPPPLPAPQVVKKPTEPEIRYPLPAPETDGGVKPLPPLGESDPAAQEAAAGIIDRKTLERFFNLDLLVRRIVVTLDNLPRRKIPQLYALTKPVEGKLQIVGKDNTAALKADNYARYAAHVKLLESIDTKKLVGIYTHFYPLLQEEYKNSENPRQYFNDRVVEVIDHLLGAPEVKEPVKLVRPKVFYEFADPKLEALSAGQKMMIRIGPDNAKRVKAKLQDIRRELTAAGKQG
jgi:hypothetical protein